MENSDTITAQVKARSRIFHWVMLAYENTRYLPKIKIKIKIKLKNLDLSYDMNHSSTIVNTFSYELHLRLELPIKALAYPLDSCGVRRIPSAGRAKDSGRKIHVGNIKALIFPDERDCCRWIGTRSSSLLSAVCISRSSCDPGSDEACHLYENNSQLNSIRGFLRQHKLQCQSLHVCPATKS